MSEHKDGDVITVRSTFTQRTYQYVWKSVPPAGTMKVVYFAPDKKYVVAFYKDKPDSNAIDRLQNIVGIYREKIFNNVGGDYWKDIYCWPYDLVRDGDRVGIIVPAYDSRFFFRNDGPVKGVGPAKGSEKNGMWFTTPQHLFGLLNKDDRGDWHQYLNLCLRLARGVRRMHMAGLAHSDLSYNNVLVDPSSSSAVIIDIDGLVVPGKYPPDVMGTPDFIAPEVYATMNLPKEQRKLPEQTTDLHALAVLVYMYLLHRHPLRGKQICDFDDANRDIQLSMGERAIFIENPQDKRNRYDLKWVKDEFPPSKYEYVKAWMDLDKLPYTILGPHLKELFDRAFIKGLHAPGLRPKAFEWEEALALTMDLVLKCDNPKCTQKWFVYTNQRHPHCPFCGSAYTKTLPILDLYNDVSKGQGSYRPANQRIVVTDGTWLYHWHSDPHLPRNERLTPEQSKPYAYFRCVKGKWVLTNQCGKELLLYYPQGTAGQSQNARKVPLPAGKTEEIVDGMKIRLGGEGSRLAVVQFANT